MCFLDFYFLLFFMYKTDTDIMYMYIIYQFFCNALGLSATLCYLIGCKDHSIQVIITMITCLIISNITWAQTHVSHKNQTKAITAYKKIPNAQISNFCYPFPCYLLSRQFLFLNHSNLDEAGLYVQIVGYLVPKTDPLSTVSLAIP